MEIPKLDVEYAAHFCFACSQQNPIGLKLKPVQQGEKVTAEFTAGEFHQGWDNVIHGGILYTLLDEVTAYAMLCHGIELGVTAKSEIRFKQLAPINQPIQASAWVTKLTTRLVEAKGVLSLKDNTVIVDGNFLFYVLRQSKKTILWDMDGVISDSYSLHFAAWQETFAKKGIEFTKEDFTHLFGARNDFIIGGIMGKEVSEGDVKIMVQEKEETFRRKATGRIKPFPGVVTLLNALKKGSFRLGLVTSAPRENIDLALGELDLTGIFNCIVCGHEVSESKPSPQIYLLAADKLQAAPNDCVVIEDSPLGVKAAKTAGMKCLAVTNTHRRENLQDADMVVDSLQNMDVITLLMRV
ncbi:MAG: HAD-IA family hydrolase [Dehalococcoidia bacterium]|nr:HAD-IA family hydrolase [Dehalococcoidia bacterium]MDH4299154.1 HAD-IA family hydrolase [Dehalococcoidia bacterium]MDH4366866.1 HAD-IA family hydrolase [Dehalococcoidia bacterium]